MLGRRYYGNLRALDAAFTRKPSLVEADILVLEPAELRQMSRLTRGGTPGLKASEMKIRGTEHSQHLTELAFELAGSSVVPKYLNDRTGPIYVAANEIRRGILAKGQLGL